MRKSLFCNTTKKRRKKRAPTVAIIRCCKRQSGSCCSRSRQHNTQSPIRGDCPRLPLTATGRLKGGDKNARTKPLFIFIPCEPFIHRRFIKQLLLADLVVFKKGEYSHCTELNIRLIINCSGRKLSGTYAFYGKRRNEFN